MKARFTLSAKSKLSADYPGISNAPEVITDCTPRVTIADFNTTLSSISATSKAEVSISTACKLRCRVKKKK